MLRAVVGERGASLIDLALSLLVTSVVGLAFSAVWADASRVFDRMRTENVSAAAYLAYLERMERDLAEVSPNAPLNPTGFAATSGTGFTVRTAGGSLCVRYEIAVGPPRALLRASWPSGGGSCAATPPRGTPYMDAATLGPRGYPVSLPLAGFCFDSDSYATTHLVAMTDSPPGLICPFSPFGGSLTVVSGSGSTVHPPIVWGSRAWVGGN